MRSRDAAQREEHADSLREEPGHGEESTASLHVSMFGWEYPPRGEGGLGVACAGLVKGLRLHGVKVTLVLPGERNDDGNDTRRVKSTLHPYDDVMHGNHAMDDGRHLHDLYGGDLGRAVSVFTDTAVRRTKHLKPDIIHSHDWMTFGAGVMASRTIGRPFIAHVHSTEMDRTNGKPHEWIFGHEQWGLNHANHIIAVSRYTKNVLISSYGIPPEKITVIHNGAPMLPAKHLSRKNAKLRHPLVLFLGRLTVQKGPHEFLSAAKRVLEQRPDVLFIVAGDGYMLRELIERSCALGMQDSVLFTGRVGSEEARASMIVASGREQMLLTRLHMGRNSGCRSVEGVGDEPGEVIVDTGE
ncbi:glycosyltransferase family 4 protein [Candidatus Peregrinibacteria bacterium]|nr:glycosyltransferase family 4 protein [Candidatus Peregrinibacteria bacterium]MBI3816199.1 glycosyltransferase family 4 protein [Candidatus Peregrinibacteria bacterium]